MVSRMSRKTWLIVAIGIVAIAAAVGIAVTRDSPGLPSDTLTIITWNETSLSEVHGNRAILNFWSIGCRHCVTQLPYLESVAKHSVGEIEVIAINIRDDASRLQTFFADYEPAMVIAMDRGGKAFKQYCLAYNNTRGLIPFTLFVDGEGTVRYVKIGAFASEEALWNALRDVFGTTIP